MDSPDLHGDALLVRHLLARLSPSERESVLSLQPEVREPENARDELLARIAANGSPSGWPKEGAW